MDFQSDRDMKIAGSHPSVDIAKNRRVSEPESVLTPEEIALAKKLGKKIAECFVEDAKRTEQDDNGGDFEMMLQRRLLLSFTATVGFERYCRNDTLAGIAQKSFLDTVKKSDKALYSSSSDTGAFSFYYLAFRRGNEIDRRMGQTFAMLCSHDGDPIFQELGEALYCWFSSEVRKAAEELGL
ncbi:MAG: hypothetical protein IKI29_02905 [Clostridia bacterium]|nr:hypothetical protein [Clostridia bacterium]